MKKAVITVVGKDSVGIIAKVCTYLAENNINILDISQTIVQEYFNMMMIVDFSKTEKTFWLRQMNWKTSVRALVLSSRHREKTFLI